MTATATGLPTSVRRRFPDGFYCPKLSAEWFREAARQNAVV
jgi:hypothetical protein